MRRKSLSVLAVAALCVVLGGPGCILEEKVVEVVLTGETCAEFVEYHESEEFATPDTVDYAFRLNDILEENGLDRSDIAEARVMSATYQVTDFDHSHDWSVSGSISVERLGGGDPETIINYTNQSLLAAQPAPVAASLNADGVLIVNQALQDYLDGGYPVLVFEVVNGTVDPDPSSSDPIVFDWEACIKIHILYQEEVEVPDPM